MDRLVWGDIVGDELTIEDDLRWTLFQAERSIVTMEQRDDDHKDWTLLSLNKQRVTDAKTALAALWRQKT